MTEEERENEKKKRIVVLTAKKDWLMHPTTEEYLLNKRKEVERISQLLSEKEDLAPEERLTLFGERKAHRFDISQMTGEPDNEIQILKRQLNETE